MGSCFSKKTSNNNNVNVSVPTSLKQQQQQQQQQQTQPLQVTHHNKTSKKETDVVDNKKVAEQQQQVEEDNNGVPKKEIFVIKHRKSHDRDKRSPPSSVIDVQPQPQQPEANCGEIGVNQTNNILTGVRTSSCTKEEVDAILIQCGRLSRSNSGTGKALSSGRKYSGSKRSYDFDQEADEVGKENGDEDNGAAERRQHRQRHRQSGRASPSPQGRRRTPSRERDQQRSGSRERSGGGGSRRVSRSPGRRSEIPASADNTSGNSARPGKMVSVPATVSSMAMDKSNNAGETTAIKRISVKRNVGEGNVTASSRTAASPRSESPARMNGRVGNEHNNGQSQQQPSLSRNNSRKAEQSPYRRNPLSEIDNNGNIKDSVNVQNQIPSKKVSNCSTKEAQGQPTMTVNVVASTGVESLLKPEGLTRTRSARRSRDLDFNPDGSSYTALLLEDIQNFHQKSTPSPAVSIPACVAKACSIVEAVADLNSTTGSNMSYAFSDDRRSPPAAAVIGNLVGKKSSEAKDPFVESEVLGSDDLMEPSFHKYVTVQRGGALSVDDMDGQESSGSNSIVGGSQQQWGFSSTSSTWEPNSADSTDCWTSRSNNRDDNNDKSPLGIQRKHTTPESSRDMEEARKGFSGQRNGIGRGRIGGGSSSGKNLHRMTTTSIVAANVSA